MSSEAMTTKEVARELGVSVRYVQMLVKDGALPSKRFGRAIVIDRKALRRFSDLRGKERPIEQ